MIIKINFSFLKKITVISLLPIVIYGCGNSLPEASDEQIIEFFSHGNFGFSRNKVISEDTVQCLATLSNASFDGFEAPPKELADFMRADCQSMLLNMVNDKNINLVGFKMKDFENKDLTKRVYNLRKVSIIADEQRRIEDEKKATERRIEDEKKAAERRIEAEKKAKQKAIDDLKQQRDKYAAFVNSLDEQLLKLRHTCDEFQILSEEIRNVNENKAIMLKWDWKDNCKNDPATIKIEANKLLAKFDQVQISGSGNSWYFSTPYIPNHLNELAITNSIKFLNNKISEMKTILGR